MTDIDRCSRHRTVLTDDAIRGPFCQDCDTEDDTFMVNLWHRFWASVWRRLTFTA